jgi:S1-C subfamily serine protease
MYDFTKISNVVFSVAKVGPNGVQLLGTAFLTNRKGIFATVAHVAGQDDANLNIAFKPITSISDYQDTSDNSVQLLPVKIHAFDPIHDLCLLKSEQEISSNIVIGCSDDSEVGENVSTFGYPHNGSGVRLW